MKQKQKTKQAKKKNSKILQKSPVSQSNKKKAKE